MPTCWRARRPVSRGTLRHHRGNSSTTWVKTNLRYRYSRKPTTLLRSLACALMFAVIALTILMASVLIGLNFANWLVAPIRSLMDAANVVSTGDLNVQVPVHRSEGDLAQLGQTFNKMTQELRTQRDELVSASDLIDSRRRFIEAVLSSASAGIIGVDASGSVGILNRSAEKLIGHSEAETLDHPLSDVLPELDEMMKTAREGTQRLVQG